MRKLGALGAISGWARRDAWPAEAPGWKVRSVVKMRSSSRVRTESDAPIDRMDVRLLCSTGEAEGR